MMQPYTWMIKDDVLELHSSLTRSEKTRKWKYSNDKIPCNEKEL